jgi:hypothetical protein
VARLPLPNHDLVNADGVAHLPTGESGTLPQ